MMNLIILAVMIVVLMGAATYGLVGALRSLQTSIETLVIQDRLEEATQGVLANIVSVASSNSQTYYVPAPDNLNMPAVPSWITPNAQTSRGVKFLYCPFSNASGTGSLTIASPNAANPNSTYTVNIGNIYAGANISSNNYVTQASTRPSNAAAALAILVAPGANQSAILSTQDCMNVSNAGTLPGAYVRIITEAEVQSRAQVSASSGVEFYAASSASGDGKGSSTSNYAQLSTVMDYVNKFRPQNVTINLNPNDNFAVSASDMDQSSVTTREFSTVRNHSIAFLPATGSSFTGYNTNYTATTSLTTNEANPFTPITLGNIYFRDVSFQPSTSTVYLPTAQTFGNVILNYPAGQGNAPYAAADNLGKIFIGGGFNPRQTASSYQLNTAAYNTNISSGIEYQTYYLQRGGTLENDGTEAINNVGGNNLISYNDYGGNTVLNAILATNLYNKVNIPAFFVNGGSTLLIGTTGGILINDQGNIYPALSVDLGGRMFQDGSEYINNTAGPAIYNRGGMFVTSNTAAILANQITGADQYYAAEQHGFSFSGGGAYGFESGPGANFAVTSSASINYDIYQGSPNVSNISTFHSNTATTQNRLASLIGGSTFTHDATHIGSQEILRHASNTGSCLSDLNAYHAASDAGNVQNATLTPKGNIGMEAAIMLNRSDAICH